MCSGSKASPGISPLGKKCRALSTEMRYGRSWAHLGVGGGPSGLPGPPHAGPANGRSRTLPSGQCCTQVIKPADGAIPGRCFPPSSYVGCRPTESGQKLRGNAYKPCSSSWPHWCRGPRGQISPSRYQNTALNIINIKYY